MAENGNRGPNDFRSRVRKRREPPIIDGSAMEVPAEDGDAASPDIVPPPSDAAPHAAGSADAPSAEPAVETAEPVLFGSAFRDPPPRAAEASPDVAAVPPEAMSTAEAGDTVPPGEPAVRAAPEPAYAGTPVSPVARQGGGAAPWLLTLSTLVLLGALAWVLYTEPQRNGRGALAALDAKVAALEARPDPSGLQADVAALGKRLAAADAERSGLSKSVTGLTTRLDGVSQQAQAARTEADRPAAPPAPVPTGAAAVATVGALAALAAKLDGIDGRVASLASDQGRSAKALADLPKPVAPDFGPVNARVAALDARLASDGEKIGAADTRLSSFDGRLTAVDGKVNGSDARLNGFDAKVNGVDGKVNGFDARMNGLDARMNSLEGKSVDAAAQSARLQSTVANLPKVDLAPLQSATAALDGRVVRVEGQLSAVKDSARVTEARAVGSADETRATPIALVGQSIRSAIADGRPYGPDLDALKALGADPDAVAKLAPLAAKGAPTPAALKERWEAVQGDVLAAVKPAESGSALDRFAASARGLVQVRHVGAVAGDDPVALVSQVDAALAADDVPAALAAWGRLPTAGQDRSRDWATAARDEAAAAAAVQGLVGRAIATLGRTKS